MMEFGSRDDMWLSDMTILSHGAIISSKLSIDFEMLINLTFSHILLNILTLQPGSSNFYDRKKTTEYVSF